MIEFVKEIYEGMKTFMVGMKVTGDHLKDNLIKENLGGTRDRNDPFAPITIEYDGTEEKAREVQVADRFRGHLHNDIERCIVCRNCATACPIDCFFIDGERTVTNKWRPSRFDIDILKCMYCGLCVVACPTGCLTMTHEWWGSQRAGTPDVRGGNQNLHGLLREFGVGYYGEEEKVRIEKQRIRLAEEKKKKAAELKAQRAAAAKAKAAAAAAKKAAESGSAEDAPAQKSGSKPAPESPSGESSSA